MQDNCIELDFVHNFELFLPLRPFVVKKRMEVCNEERRD